MSPQERMHGWQAAAGPCRSSSPCHPLVTAPSVQLQAIIARTLLHPPLPCSLFTQKPVAAWALGATEQEFSSAAVYDYATNVCYAPVRQRGTASAGKTGGSVLAWSADATGGSITQLARSMHLPALHALFPVSHTPEGEEEEAAAAEAEEKAEAEQVDGSGAAVPGAVAVFAAGGAALCSGTEVVAEAEEARVVHTVAAAYQRGVLVAVHAEPRAGGAASATVYRVQVCWG